MTRHEGTDENSGLLLNVRPGHPEPGPRGSPDAAAPPATPTGLAAIPSAKGEAELSWNADVDTGRCGDLRAEQQQRFVEKPI